VRLGVVDEDLCMPLSLDRISNIECLSLLA
jgi:hypothetical protein